MRNKRWWIFLMVVGLALLIVDSSAFSFQDTKKTRETLRGVTPIYVVIEGVTPELEQVGMSLNQLKTDVESKLRNAGIDVITTLGERESAGSFPAGLYVRINALKSDILRRTINIDYYAISIQVELIQQCLPLTHESVSRVSEKNIDPSYVSFYSALGCTWSTNNIYLAGGERIIDIRGCVQELVDQFIKAYLSVNPKM
jgi:hypothetical protein